MDTSHLLQTWVDGANETWRPSSPHPLLKSQTKRPRTYQSDYSTNGGQVARGQRIGEDLGLYRGRRTRDSRNSVMPSSCILHATYPCIMFAAQGYMIICLCKCWVCWSNKSFALSPGRLPSVEGNGTWNVYTVSSSSMLGRQTNRDWTGDDRVAAPSQRPPKLSIQKWHDATRFDIISLSHQADAICEILPHLSVCTSTSTTRCLMKTTLMLTAQSTTWTH